MSEDKENLQPSLAEETEKKVKEADKSGKKKGKKKVIKIVAEKDKALTVRLLYGIMIVGICLFIAAMVGVFKSFNTNGNTQQNLSPVNNAVQQQPAFTTQGSIATEPAAEETT